MKRSTRTAMRMAVCVPTMLTATIAWAGGGGGGGSVVAPEPAFLTMCAIVASAEITRRWVNKTRK